MIFTIGTHQFKSKNKATEFFKDYFQGLWKRQEKLSQDDKNTLNSLLHQRVDFQKEFVDNVITDFQIITNRFCAFEIQYFDSNLNEWVPFSISQCIVGKARTERFQLCKNFREKVNDQIQNYRSQFKPEEIKCKLCDCKTDIEVDHLYPFASIVDDFIAEGKAEELFPSFHLEKATYRFLCKYHNTFEPLKSGPRKTMSQEEYLEKNRMNAKARYQPRKKLL